MLSREAWEIGQREGENFGSSGFPRQPPRKGQISGEGRQEYTEESIEEIEEKILERLNCFVQFWNKSRRIRPTANSVRGSGLMRGI